MIREYLSFSCGALVCLVPAISTFHRLKNYPQSQTQQQSRSNNGQSTPARTLLQFRSSLPHLFIPITRLYKPSPSWAAAHRGKTTSRDILAHHRPLATLNMTSGLVINITESDTCATRSERRRSEAGRMESSLLWPARAKIRSTQLL